MFRNSGCELDFAKRILLLTAVRAWHFNGGVFAAASLSNLRLQGMGGMDVYRSDADQKLEEPPGATSTATVRNEDGGLWGGMDVLKPGSPQAALRPVRRFTSAADGPVKSHAHLNHRILPGEACGEVAGEARVRGFLHLGRGMMTSFHMQNVSALRIRSASEIGHARRRRARSCMNHSTADSIARSPPPRRDKKISQRVGSACRAVS
jgi:hypothetical protein